MARSLVREPVLITWRRKRQSRSFGGSFAASRPFIAVTDSAQRARAAALGKRIRVEDGVACAVEVIERRAADFSHRLRENSSSQSLVYRA